MNALSAITVVCCAQAAASVTEDVYLRSLPLHDHPSLIAMAEQNNHLRSTRGLSPHAVSPRLTELAQEWANYMASTGYYQHNYGHGYSEIIHTGPVTIEGAFDGWMRSGPHYSIMMSGATHAGFGYQISPYGQPYWVGVYGNMAGEAPPETEGGNVLASAEQVNRPPKPSAATDEAGRDATVVAEADNYYPSRNRFRRRLRWRR